MTAGRPHEHLSRRHRHLMAAAGNRAHGSSLTTSESAQAPSPTMLRWVDGVLADTNPAWISSLQGVEVLRDGPKKLAIISSYDGAEMVLKQYADDRGAWTRRWLQRLAAAGLAPPAQFTVALERGWSGAHRTLVTDLAAGHSWTQWLLASARDRDAAALAAAHWLVRLQSLPMALADRTGYRAGAELRRHARRLGELYPDHSRRLCAIASAAYGRLYDHSTAPPHLVASHGDLHPQNLFLSTGEPLAVTAIDLDTAGLRRPAYDVGYALAQMLVISWMRTGSFCAGAGAGLTFWRRWTDWNGADAEAVPAEITRALLQSLHFELVTYGNGRTDLLDRWLGVAEAVLASGVPATLSTLATQEVTL